MLKKVTTTRVFLILGLLGGYSLLIGCNGNANDIKEVNSDDFRKELAPTEVEIIRAVKKPFNYQIHSNGVVRPANETEIVFKTGGSVTEYYIREGKEVKKGQILAVISNVEQAMALSKAQIHLKESQLEFESQLLASGGRGDSTQMAEVRENLAYVSGLKAAELEYKQAQLLYNNTFIKAPISGILSNLQTVKGATVVKGDKLCKVYGSNNLLVQTEVLESVIGKVKIGQQVDINPLALDKTFKAVVQSINPWVNEHGTVSLTLEIRGSTGLMPGMHVAVIIKAPYNKNIIVPETALVIRSGKEVVFIEKDGLAKWHYVTTGLKSNNEVEVLTGLEEGDKVITTNNIYLAHDTPVKAQNTNNKKININ